MFLDVLSTEDTWDKVVVMVGMNFSGRTVIFSLNIALSH